MAGRDEDFRRMARQAAAETVAPARKRVIYPNVAYDIDTDADEKTWLIARIDAPYERLDFPVTIPALEELLRKAKGSKVVVPPHPLPITKDGT